VQYIVCSDENDEAHPLLVMPAPIQFPSLTERAGELPRIVDEYAQDAITALRARSTSFTDRDRAWVLGHEASSLSEIEKATLRLVALRTSANLTGAAERLGIAPVSLSRWVGRRKLGP
jgi:transcriptional regulator with GAF, ATPase, and Fis domain